MANHPIVHIDIPANDREAAGQFYADLFGWQVRHINEMNYSLFEAEGGPGGGFSSTADGQAEPDKVLIYVLTDDIEASLAKAESLGGRTVMPKMEIPNTGWMAIFSDPTGNRIGLYTNMD